MQKYKICVYAICKNEEKFVDRWIDSMSEADLIIVTDTGSDDRTVERLIARGATVYTEKIRPWRFDTARNISLDYVPEDVDICVCTDLDEIFEKGWRKKLESTWRSKETASLEPVAIRGEYIYNWSLNSDGTPDVQFFYSKIHSRQGFRWTWPIHEYLQYVGSIPLERILIKGVTLNHYPDPLKSRGSYLPLLELAVKEAPTDDRMRYYLGREYMYNGQWSKCVYTLEMYLKLPTSVWNEERSAAMRWIAKSYHMLEQIKEAYKWHYRAIAEAPNMRESYVDFAKMCYELKDWGMVFYLAEDALKIKEKSRTFVNMGYAWDYTADDLCSIAAYELNIMHKSLEHSRNALSYAPNNERLQSNLKIVEETIKIQGILSSKQSKSF